MELRWGVKIMANAAIIANLLKNADIDLSVGNVKEIKADGTVNYDNSHTKKVEEIDERAIDASNVVESKQPEMITVSSRFNSLPDTSVPLQSDVSAPQQSEDMEPEL